MIHELWLFLEDAYNETFFLPQSLYLEEREVRKVRLVIFTALEIWLNFNSNY